MTKSAEKLEQAAEHVFDVAISFLVADQRIASTIKSKLAGLDVFFYPHNQEELIGTNGLESMQAPFRSARVNVVLYRTRYGETPWTAVEQAAIQGNCLKTAYRSLLFVQINKNDPLPVWLPDTHIRCVLADFTIEQLVGAIKHKVQERGGVIHRPDAMGEAERVKREAEYLTDRVAMMRDRAWIENTVHCSIREAFQKVEALVAQTNKAHDFQIACRSRGHHACVMRSGFVSLGCYWVQPVLYNVSDEHGDCQLRIAAFAGCLLLPGETALVLSKPCLLEEHQIKVDVNENRQLVWLNGNEQIEPERLADHIVIIHSNEPHFARQPGRDRETTAVVQLRPELSACRGEYFEASA